MHILLVGVVYPILVVSIAVVDSATVSTRIYGQPLRLVVVCLPPPAVEHHPLEALVTLQGKKDGKYICTCLPLFVDLRGGCFCLEVVVPGTTDQCGHIPS